MPDVIVSALVNLYIWPYSLLPKNLGHIATVPQIDNKECVDVIATSERHNVRESA